MKTIYLHRFKMRSFRIFVLLLLSGLSVNSFAQINIWTDNFNNAVEQHFDSSIPADWVCSGTSGQHWTYYSSSGFCSNGGARCTPNSGNYSSNVDVYMTKTGLNFSGYSSVEFTFSFTGRTENTDDYVQFQYYSGGTWTTVSTITGNYSSGWNYTVGTIPTTTTGVRFYFHSDNSSNYTGITIDDINITPLNWTVSGPSNALDYWMPSDFCGSYARYSSSTQSMRCTARGDNYSASMNNSLVRTGINLSGYGTGVINFKVWNKTETNYDSIYFEYYSGTLWTVAWSQSGDYSGTGWQDINNIIIPNTTTQIRFRFKSDNSVQYEGVYIDDVVLNANPACTYPATQASSLSFTSAGCDRMTLNWTRGTGNNVIILAHESVVVDADPNDGWIYTANSNFGSGSQVGIGNYVVYNGNGTSVTVNNLNPSKVYYYNLYEYSTSGPCYKMPPLTGNSSTLYAPYITTQPLSQTALPGGSLNFTVVVAGAGTLSYQWQVSTNGGFTWNNISAAGSNPTYIGYLTASLQVMSVVAGNNGYQYRCVISGGTCSPSSVTSDAAVLTIGSCNTPGIPTALSASANGPYGATLSWTASSTVGSPTVQYYWAVGTVSNVTYEANYVQRGITVNPSEVVTNLNCNTSYYFVVKAVTTCNNSTFGYPTAVTFSTPNLCTSAYYYYRTRNSGSWNGGTTWNRNANCVINTGSNTSAMPTNGNCCHAQIESGRAVTITANLIVPPNINIASGGSLTINSNFTFTIPSGITLVNYGTLTINANGIFNILGGGKFVNYGTFINNGTFNVSGSSGITATFVNFGTVTNNASKSVNFNNYSTISNYLTMTNNGTLTTSGSSCVFNNYGTYNENFWTRISGATASGSTFNNYKTGIINISSAGLLSVGVTGASNYYGTLNNYGTINNNATTSSTNYGIYITHSSSNFNNLAGSTISVGSPTNSNPYLYVNAGNCNNAGLISIYGYLLGAGTFNNNSGGILNNKVNGWVNIKNLNNSSYYYDGGRTFLDGGYIVSRSWSPSTFTNNAGATYEVTDEGTNGNNYITIGWSTSYQGVCNNYGDFIINKGNDGRPGIVLDQGGTLNNYGFLDNNTSQFQISPYGLGGTFNCSGTYEDTYNIIAFTAGVINLSGGTFTINPEGSLTTDINIQMNNTQMDVYGTLYIRDRNYLYGNGSITTYPNSWLKLEAVTGDDEFINTGTSKGNIRLSGTRIFDDETNYFITGIYTNIKLGNGFNSKMRNLEVSTPYGLSLDKATEISKAFSIYSGNVNTNSNTLSVGTDLTNGGTLTLGSSTVSYTSSGRYMSNPTNIHETWEFPTVNFCVSDLLGWYSGSVYKVSEYAPRSLRRDLNLAPARTNAWIYSPQIDLTAGRTYNVSLWYRDSIVSSSHASFHINYGPNLSPTGMVQIKSTVTCASTNYVQATCQFTASASGRYYLGICGTTPAGQQLYFDDIYVSTLPYEQVLSNFDINSGGTVLLETPARVKPASGPLTLTKGAFATGANLIFDDNSTIIRSGGILSDLPAHNNPVVGINIVYNTPDPPVEILPRAELPTSATSGILNNLTINNSAGVRLGRTPLPVEILYSENFNSGVMPSGWASAVVNDVGTVGTPSISFPNICTFFSGAVTPDATSNGAAMLRFHSRTCDNSDKIDVYMTDAIDVTGYNNIKVNFDWYRQSDYWVNPFDLWSTRGNEGVTLYWSTDGSSWYQNVYFYNFEMAGTTGWQTKTVLLPKEAETGNSLYIKLQFTSMGYMDCLIDNFTITAMQYNGRGLNVTVNGGGSNGYLLLQQGALYLNSDTITINNSLTTGITKVNGYIVSDTYDNGSSIDSGFPANTCTSRVKWVTGNSTGTYVYPFANNSGTMIPFTADVTTGGDAGGSIIVSTYPTTNLNYPYPAFPIPISSMAGGIPWEPDNSHNVIDRFYSVAYDGFSVAMPVGTMKFTYDPATDLESGLDETMMQAQYWDVSQDTAIWSTNMLGTGAGLGYVDGVELSDIATTWALVHKYNPLPVSLLDFDASCSNGDVVLEWSTATETNNDYFALEKSSDAKNWAKIAIIDGAGNSNSVLNYEYTDKHISSDVSYYRLIQTDYDGKTETFGPISVKCIEENDANADFYPNPFNGELIVNCSNIEGSTVIKLFDMVGNLVFSNTYSLTGGNNSIVLDLQSFSKGIYYIELSSGTFTQRQKVMKN